MQNTAVNSDSIMSTYWHSHLQTTAYLLSAHQELPNVDVGEINCICAIQSWYLQAELESLEGQLTDQEKVPTHTDYFPLKKGNSYGHS